MTVQDVTPLVSYTLTGISDYSFSFEIFDETDLTVVYVDLTDTVSTWVLNTDYTVTINVDRTGNITVLDTGLEGKITITRDLPATQEVDWVNNDPLDMEVQEASFDKLTMLIQEIESQMLIVPPGFPAGVELPLPSSEAVIGWSTDETTLVNYPSYGSFQSLADAAAASAAAALVSETNAAASESAAALSETNAAASESAAAASASAASSSASSAAASAAAAAVSETAAQAAQSAAETAQTAAELAEANAAIWAQESANCAAAAYDSQTAAATSEANAAASEAAALASENKAYQWAQEAYGVEVETGEYSAYHWATVAQNAAIDEWEEIGNIFRPIVSGDGQLGDATHLINSIYLGDSSPIYFGNSQDANIQMGSANLEMYIDGTFNNGLRIEKPYDGTSISSLGIGNNLYLYNSDGSIDDGYVSLGFAKSTTGVLTQAALVMFSVTPGNSRFGFYLEDSNAPIEVASLTNDGSLSLTGGIYLGDSSPIYFGDSQDASIAFDGTDLNATVSSANFLFHCENVGIGNYFSTNPGGGQSDWPTTDALSRTLYNTLRIGYDLYNSGYPSPGTLQLSCYGSASDTGGGVIQFLNTRYGHFTAEMNSTREGADAGKLQLYTYSSTTPVLNIEMLPDGSVDIPTGPLTIGGNTVWYDGNDSGLVHIADAETITGTKTFSVGPITNNGTYYKSKETDTTTRSILGITLTDLCFVGTPNLPTNIQSNGTLTHNSVDMITDLLPTQSVSGTVLQTDGAGTLSWANVTGSLTSWEENGTTLRPTTAGYDLGDTTYTLGDIYIGTGVYIYIGDSQEVNFTYEGVGQSLSIQSGSSDLAIFNVATTYEISLGVANFSIKVSDEYDAIYSTVTNFVDLGRSALPFKDIYAIGVYNTTTSARNVYVDATGQLGYLSSARKNKIDIEDIKDSEWIYDLKPRQFKYKNSKDKNLEYGFVADEVEEVNSELCFYDENEDTKEQEAAGVNYRCFHAALTNEIQKLRAELNELKGISNNG